LEPPLDLARLRRIETITSTNDAARAWARQGAPDGACVVADTQTAGRGRRGRNWHSPPGCNLYLSRVTRVRAEGAGLVPLLGAVATRESLALFLAGSTPVVIKWPNDLLAGGRKLAGVLAEVGDEARAGPRAVVILGIGINVNAGPEQLPAAPRLPAGSLRTLAGRPIDREALLADLLIRLDRWRRLLEEEPGRLVGEMRQHCASLGQLVRVSPPGAPPFEAIAREIGPTGALLVERSDGQKLEILAGDVDPIPTPGSRPGCG
jgi:BirA family biotin operon repressor/biotin-[acetyl-CoA-carboxylase] ligase